MTKTVLLSIFGGLAFLTLVGGCLSISVGRWDLPWFKDKREGNVRSLPSLPPEVVIDPRRLTDEAA